MYILGTYHGLALTYNECFYYAKQAGNTIWQAYSLNTGQQE